MNMAHRGASGMYPEHTILAYEKAAEQNADFVECDVTVSKDLILLCTHVTSKCYLKAIVFLNYDIAGAVDL